LSWGAGVVPAPQSDAVAFVPAHQAAGQPPTITDSASRTGNGRTGLVVVVVSPIGWKAPVPTA
jgi:hypothetical protein